MRSEKLDRAAEVVHASNDAGAAYHLAKQYEAKEMIRQAIQFYQRAQRFNHAIRLAREHDLASELNMMAINADWTSMWIGHQRGLTTTGIGQQRVSGLTSGV